jgi:hypothetical protein
LQTQTAKNKKLKMKLSVSAYRAQASAHKKILNSSYQMLLNYGATCTTSQSQQPTSSLGRPSVKVGTLRLVICFATDSCQNDIINFAMFMM